MTAAFHRQRLARWLRDLDVHPASLLPAADGTHILDDATGKCLAFAPANSTEAEGMISAIKLASSVGVLLVQATALIDALADEDANHGGLVAKGTLLKASQLRLTLSEWGKP